VIKIYFQPGALRVSEERWRNLFENAPVGIGLTGSRGRFVAANPAYQRMVGYSEAELRELTPLDITHEDDRASSMAFFAAHSAGERYPQRLEKRYRRKDGVVTWAELSGFRCQFLGASRSLGGSRSTSPTGSGPRTRRDS